MAAMAPVDGLEQPGRDGDFGPASANMPQTPDGAPSLADMLRDAVVGHRDDLSVTRHCVAGEPRYVLRDDLSFQSRSLNAKEYRIFSELNAGRTCGDTFDRLVAANVVTEDDAESFYAFLLALQQRGLLDLPVCSGAQLYEKHKQRKRRFYRTLPMQVLFWKFSFGNPDAIVTKITPYLKGLFTWQAGVLWLMLNALALTALGTRWNEFVAPLGTVLTEPNLWVLFVLLCLLKLWHEIGHAVACKASGGAIHDWGVILIVGAPCAYVDASSAWLMPSRWRRMVISMGGIYFESLIAIVATAVWVFSESPSVQSLAHQTLVMATLTTVLFNANPLMKFDGYYVLSDALDMPNFRSRADAACRWLAKRFLFGVPCPPPEATNKRTLSLALFGTLSAVYRVVIVVGIVGVLMWRLPAIGLVAGFCYLAGSLGAALWQLARYVHSHPEVVGKRRRACGAIALAATLLFSLIALPIQRTVTLGGVVTHENEVYVRSQASGILCDRFAAPGDHVATDDLLGLVRQHDVDTSVTRLAARHRALQMQYLQAAAVRSNDAESFRHQLKSVGSRLAAAEQRNQELEVRAPAEGFLVEWQDGVEPGAGVQDGQLLARIGCGTHIVRLLLNQRELSEYQPQVGEKVAVVFPWDWNRRYEGRVLRVATSRQIKVQDLALTQLGGGDIEVSPYDMSPTADVYAVDVALPNPPELAQRSGARASVQWTNRQTRLADWLWYRWLDIYRGYLRDVTT